VYFKDGQVRASYAEKDGLGRGNVFDLYQDGDGALWAATQGGLSRISEGHVATLTGKNGLPCDAVLWMREDDTRDAWLYTPCGLVRIAHSELQGWVSDPHKVIKSTLFDASDGIRTNATSTGSFPNVTLRSDGTLWFTVWDGVSVIDPHHLAFNKLPPPVHIEQVTADDKTYDATNGLRLPQHVRYLTIDYTALSLVAPEKVRFRYKLEGEDKDWREVVNDRQVQYTNLAPKHYRFRVLACNNSAVWNEQGASLEFVIPPAWYQTNWFYALCAATFLLMLWGLYHLRVLQLQREFNAALEARVGERTRVARELHDTLLQSFHGLLLRFQTVFQLLPERPIEAKERLGSAIDQAAEAITEGRDAVQGLRDSVVQKNDLALAISTLGEELVTASTNHRPAFGVAVEGDSRDLHPIIRDEIYKVAAEALRNTFRHAGAKHVEVEIRYDNKQFRLRVRDDGGGVDPKVLAGDGREGHYGMHGMRERTEVIGGKLEIWSQLNAGTEVELTIPANLAYAGSRRLAWLTQRLARKESGD
jgi:signal transduction histidine kinase